MTKAEIAGKHVEVFQSGTRPCPIIYLNEYEEHGEEIFRIAKANADSPFTLVSINALDWNRDMTPWPSPPLFRNSKSFSGCADAYLDMMCTEIIPEIEKEHPCSWRAIAGYSLAGLFAIYSLYRTDMFSKAASVSGSLWYPGIIDFIKSSEMKGKVDAVYLSLGDKESNVRNVSMQCVEGNTEEIERIFRSKGLDTVFQLNEGNHFKDAEKRTAAAILWLLEN